MTETLRSLPSVDALLKTPAGIDLEEKYGHQLTVQALRFVLDEARQSARQEVQPPSREEILSSTAQTIASWTRPTLQPVINATGVVIHTNLGRAPLSKAAVQAMQDVAAGYSSLEFDLDSGRRGSRLGHAESLLQRLCAAEAAVVVNNNAAAVLLALSALANHRRVVIARSQLVEIGGGFRVPDVMRQSGARLVEIGATNRVHLADYETALEQPAALVLRAHRSNFKIIGFTEEPSISEITVLAHARGVPVMDDLGSGSLMDTSRYGLEHEPTLQDSLAAQVDLVCFSGDKLLGGPQAGIIVGKAELLHKIKKHPLVRAVRADKLCLAALSATLLHYLKGEAEREIPVWRMIAAPLEQLHLRAARWQSLIARGDVIQGLSTVGGGSLPGETLPTWLLALDVGEPKKFLAHLRNANPPVIARIEEDRILCDPRTVLPEQEDDLLRAIQEVL